MRIAGFTEFIARHIVAGDQPTLLAVSGGVDSVTLVHLFADHQLPFAIAHCNYKKRGKESDLDEALVEELAAHHRVPLHIIEASELPAGEQGFQAAARDFRYQWMEDLCSEYGYARIATAHHADDNVETFFINLLRGSGAAGLSGIAASRGLLIRPLLETPRSEILAYARTNNLTWREDASNMENQFRRNQIRNLLLPVLGSIAPSYRTSIHSVLHHQQQLNRIAEEYFRNHEMLILRDGDRQSVQNKELLALPEPAYFLHRWLGPLGFSREMIPQILQAATQTTTQRFFSGDYALTVDRGQLLVLSSNPPSAEIFLSKADTAAEVAGMRFTIEILDHHAGAPSDPLVAALDLEKLEFPLTLRTWQAGDRFQPLGMQGTKKLSDFFTDVKAGHEVKQAALVLVSGNNIAWIAGHRIAEPFRVTGATKKIYLVRLVR